MIQARYWVAANALGLAVFVYFSSWIWAPFGQEGLLGGPGDALVWGTTALPTFLLFTLVDLAWFVWIIISRKQSKLKSLAVWVLVALCWFAAQMWNRSRSFTGADFEGLIPSSSSPSPNGPSR